MYGGDNGVFSAKHIMAHHSREEKSIVHGTPKTFIGREMVTQSVGSEQGLIVLPILLCINA